MLLLLLAAYVAVAVCVGIVLKRRKYADSEWISNRLIIISLAVAWPVHLWSWFSEFRKELF